MLGTQETLLYQLFVFYMNVKFIF